MAVKYIIDGANVAYWKDKSVMSLIAPLQLVLYLIQSGHDVYCIFDANTRHVITEKALYIRCLGLSNTFKEVTGGIRADDFILLYASASEDSCIISNDQYRDKKDEYPWLSTDRGKNRLIKGDIIHNQIAVPSLKLLLKLENLTKLQQEIENYYSGINQGESKYEYNKTKKENNKTNKEEQIQSTDKLKSKTSELTKQDECIKNEISKIKTISDTNTEASNKEYYRQSKCQDSDKPQNYTVKILLKSVCIVIPMVALLYMYNKLSNRFLMQTSEKNISENNSSNYKVNKPIPGVPKPTQADKDWVAYMAEWRKANPIAEIPQKYKAALRKARQLGMFTPEQLQNFFPGDFGEIGTINRSYKKITITTEDQIVLNKGKYELVLAANKSLNIIFNDQKDTVIVKALPLWDTEFLARIYKKGQRIPTVTNFKHVKFLMREVSEGDICIIKTTDQPLTFEVSY